MDMMSRTQGKSSPVEIRALTVPLFLVQCQWLKLACPVIFIPGLLFQVPFTGYPVTLRAFQQHIEIWWIRPRRKKFLEEIKGGDAILHPEFSFAFVFFSIFFFVSLFVFIIVLFSFYLSFLFWFLFHSRFHFLFLPLLYFPLPFSFSFPFVWNNTKTSLWITDSKSKILDSDSS